MSLNDLLQLDEVDLINLTNRGTVKRALREIEENEHTLDIKSEGTETRFEWSDPATCTFQNSGTLQDARCNCRAAGICRHIVRSVLAFQRQQDTPAEAIQTAWNPADITDSALQEFGQMLLNEAYQKLEKGVVAELIINRRPSATLVDQGVSVRFTVPHSLAYAQCDCGAQGPCAHIPLAALLFRRMQANRMVELITTQDERPLNLKEAELLRTAEVTLIELTQNGLRHVDKTGMDRLVSLEQKLRVAGFEHHAQIVAELHQELSYYNAHDARFRVETLALALGDFGIRRDALIAEKIPIPRIYVRGKDRASLPDLGQRRLLGLGCVVEVERKGTRLRAFLADHTSGQIQIAEHLFPYEDQNVFDFSELAKLLVWSGRPFALLGKGQVVSKNRNAIHDHRLRVDHHNLSVYSQNLMWEELPSKSLPESFRELQERISLLPPAALRSRGQVEDYFALKIEAREDVVFRADQQVLTCQLLDAEGTRLELVHPYFSLGESGFEAAFSALADPNRRLSFVAGRVRQTATGLQVFPSALVFENKDKTRWMLQPWVADRSFQDSSNSTRNAAPAAPPLVKIVLERLGEQLLDPNQRPDFLTLSHGAQSSGLQTLTNALKQLETPEDLQKACITATLISNLD